jgi:hypothetical protein
MEKIRLNSKSFNVLHIAHQAGIFSLPLMPQTLGSEIRRKVEIFFLVPTHWVELLIVV